MRQPPFLPQLPREEYELEGVTYSEFERTPKAHGYGEFSPYGATDVLFYAGFLNFARKSPLYRGHDRTAAILNQ